jgi:DNA-binding transcriptional MerR regulator
MNSGLSIGTTSRRTGCPVATIRYYEQIGLLRPAARSAGGRRVYGVRDIERLRLIRRLRGLDFGIEAVRTFVAALDASEPSCLSVRDLAQAHLAIVRARRAELEALERTLTGLARSCTDACSNGPTPDCTIITDFARA